MLLSEVERALKAHGIERSGEDIVLVACSGGMDSMVLAHAVGELLGWRRLVLGHVDHRVRPGSDADARFISGWAAAQPVRCSVAELAPGSASEARLRTERYAALESMRDEAGASWILTAHTADDQAETVLMGLVRSARLASLKGIPVRRGAILRPMLRVPRSAVRDYAQRHRIMYREDPTNREPAYLRNRIRKELLPLIEQRYRPGIRDRLVRLAREVATALPERRSAAASAPSPELLEAGTSATVARPTTAPVGGAVPPFASALLPWGGGRIPDGKGSALFDADLVEGLVVRPFAPGDRITPFGMRGRRKVADLLREAGVPADRRTSVAVVADAHGAVVWVPGVLRSAHAPVGPLTRRVWAFWITQPACVEVGADAREDEMCGAAQLQVESRSVTLEPMRDEGPRQPADSSDANGLIEVRDERKGFEAQESE